MLIHKLLFNLIWITVLSLLTQVGGLIYILTYPIFLFINRNLKQSFKRSLLKTSSFLTIYLASTFILIPPLAKNWGRIPLPYFHSQLKPLNYLTPLMNRHYVKKDLYNLLLNSSEALNRTHPNTIVAYMDANFPFWNGFPLIPHLSHNDGKKVDLTFLFRKINNQQAVNRRTKSWIGYGGVEKPRIGEENTAAICEKKGLWQYNLLARLTPKLKQTNIEIDEKRTKDLLKILINQPKTGKIFIEPFLKKRWELSSYNKIRFHGCHSVSHADHIHLQL